MIPSGKFVEIKSTKYEPSDFHGVKGRVIRETPLGFLVVYTTDKREIVLHPASVRFLERKSARQPATAS